MGPRPFSRGDTKKRPGRDSRTKLQWGRDLSVAETWAARETRSGPRCFNGAATFQSRRLRVQQVDQAARQLASMGPRPFSRGDSLLDAITVNIMLNAERLARSLIGAQQVLIV